MSTKEHPLGKIVICVSCSKTRDTDKCPYPKTRKLCQMCYRRFLALRPTPRVKKPPEPKKLPPPTIERMRKIEEKIRILKTRLDRTKKTLETTQNCYNTLMRRLNEHVAETKEKQPEIELMKEYINEKLWDSNQLSESDSDSVELLE